MLATKLNLTARYIMPVFFKSQGVSKKLLKFCEWFVIYLTVIYAFAILFYRSSQ